MAAKGLSAGFAANQHLRSDGREGSTRHRNERNQVHPIRRFEPNSSAGNSNLRPVGERGEWRHWTKAERDEYRGYTDAELERHLAKDAALIPLAKCMGRAITRGAISMSMAQAILRAQHPDKPVGIGDAGRAIYQEARDHAATRRRADRAVRQAIFPLICDRAPGQAILAAAASENERCQRPLKRHELLAIAREEAAWAMRRGRHPRGYR